MEKRLTSQQLQQIVGEVNRLANREQAELNRTEVQQILQELNLPPELLDEAMIQIQRREALAQQQKKNKVIAIAGVVALMIAGSLFFLFLQNKAQKIGQVSVSQHRITIVPDRGENLPAVNRGSEVVYRVTLNNATVGEKLDLSCNWLNPAGQVAHSNRYTTKSITTPVWNTQCSYQIPVSATTGSWQVRMLVGERLLQQAQFDVN